MATFSRAFLMSRCFWWKAESSFQISRHTCKQLTGQQQRLKPLTPVVWSTLRSLGILKRFRGKRGGLPSQHVDDSGSHSQDIGLYKQDNLGSFGSQISTCSASFGKLNGRNTTNLIEIKKSPYTSSRNTAKPVHFTLLNSRSIRNKTLIIKDFTVDNNVDILALTETWMSDCAIDNQLFRDICPTGYDYYSVPRGSRGGGVALVFKKMLKFKKQSLVKTKFKSFEFTDLSMKHSSTALRIVVVYRPPKPSVVNVFFEEFPRLLEELATASGSLLLVGDFNFHVDNNNDAQALRFLQLLNTFNLVQNISGSTHRNGHTLDLIITRKDENIANNFTIFDPVIADHYAVTCSLALPKPCHVVKDITYRKLTSIVMEQFCSDLSTSVADLMTESSNTSDISSSVEQFNRVLTSLLDQHAPAKTRTVILRPKAPWYDDSIREKKIERRRLERRWRKSRLCIDRELFVNKCKEVNEMITNAKMDYYSKLIHENKSNPKMLYSVVDKLLHRKTDKPLPTWNDTSALASSFSDFFRGKITNIKEDLKLLQRDSSNVSLLADESTATSRFGTFSTVTKDYIIFICEVM